MRPSMLWWRFPWALGSAFASVSFQHWGAHSSLLWHVGNTERPMTLYSYMLPDCSLSFCPLPASPRSTLQHCQRDTHFFHGVGWLCVFVDPLCVLLQPFWGPQGPGAFGSWALCRFQVRLCLDFRFSKHRSLPPAFASDNKLCSFLLLFLPE